MSEYTDEEKKAIQELDNALRGIVGVRVPYNLIVQNFKPIQLWINKVLRGNPNDYGNN